MAGDPDVSVDSPDQGESLIVKPITTKGEMVFSSNEWADPHDMSGQDVMDVLEYFTKQRDCIVQMQESGKKLGCVFP